jgi:heme exporter protein A
MGRGRDSTKKHCQAGDSTEPELVALPGDTFGYGAKPLNLRDSRAISEPGRTMPERRLQAQNLHLWRGERHVLRGVQFDLPAGECLQLMGGNGAGKTTLLRALSGLMYPEEGDVLWNGSSIRRDLQGFQGELAYIGHEPPLKVDLTPAENMRYWIGVRRPLSRADIENALDRVGGTQWRDRPVRTLSAGQKRRVALAGLLLMCAPLWLLDEPATNLDAEGQKLVSVLIEEQLRVGGLVVAAIHHELPVTGVVRRLNLGAT